ncbi:hypothetical protein L195_g019527 [Trifolium pratense]|uniref:Uncharacterized protein n=1 Tax=Trifolium pratense TaxID=57577 RepID=A0A2K3MZV1_TRIPR|nr:hypothetical protein L195_g019527 [Trifolium pratense]
MLEVKWEVGYYATNHSVPFPFLNFSNPVTVALTVTVMALPYHYPVITVQRRKPRRGSLTVEPNGSVEVGLRFEAEDRYFLATEWGGEEAVESGIEEKERQFGEVDP